MRRLVCLLWDAAGADMAERFLAEGSLPALARLAARGTRFSARPAWPCAQTPPGMATLLTGAPTHRHGVYGFREAARPRAQRNAVETETGFDARRLRAEPLWTTAARSGRSVAVAFAPFSNPHEAYAPGGAWYAGREIVTLDGYGAVLAGQACHRARDLVASSPPPPPPGFPPVVESRGFRIALPLGSAATGDPPRAAPDPAAPGEPAAGVSLGGELWLGVGRRAGTGFDRAWIRGAGASESVELPAGDRSPVAIRLAPTIGVVVCLFELAPDGSDLLFWRGGIWRLRSGTPGVAEGAYEAMGPFLGAGAGHAYRDGSLGVTCRENGPGIAERRYLGALEASAAAFTRASVHVLERHRPDATFLYEPCIDETAHIFQDLAEAALRGETGAAACGLEVLRSAYRLADEHLARVLDAVDEDTVVAVCSDHGQQAVSRLFRPNVVLHEAGLLALDVAGRVDLARTRVLYSFASNGYLLVNGDDRPHGIVPRGEVASVARAAAERLLAWRDADGAPGVIGALFPGDPSPRGHVPGEEAGDAHVLAAPGVALGANPIGRACEPAHGGQHTSALDSPELDALFVVGGGGVPRNGRAAARVDNQDVAPTLAKLVGLPPPRHSEGRILF